MRASRRARATDLLRRWIRPLVVCPLAFAATTGCYYTHLAEGHWRLLRARQPVETWLDDPGTPDPLRRQLVLSGEVRKYAAGLGLDVGEQYTSYVPWEGDRLVTTLVATRPREVEPDDFRFLLLARLPYKGYFDRSRAETEAERLRSAGFDVCVSPVVAYSTLGWTADPLTGPLLRRVGDDDELVETLVHELVHATVYWPEDADLSESAAQFVGQEAAVAFQTERGDAAAAARARQRVDDDRRIAETLLELRESVAALYASGIADDALAERRSALEDATRARLRSLPLAVRDPGTVADGARLNDACLALRGTYAADLPRHAALYQRLGSDLSAFVERLREAGADDAPRDRFFGDP